LLSPTYNKLRNSRENIIEVLISLTHFVPRKQNKNANKFEYLLAVVQNKTIHLGNN